ncbi:MAG: hypothetical protein NTZ56_04675 [Acidobacteria bacterium]|nr:hypothetical protein [Acidobacteriota bacterium]
MTLQIMVGSWIILAAGVAILAIYRGLVARNDDEFVHLGRNEGQLVESQALLGTKINALDKWGKVLTAVTFVYGAVLASVYLYGQFVEQSMRSTVGS